MTIVVGVEEMVTKKEELVEEESWKAPPERVKVPYLKRKRLSTMIQSTTGHVKPCGKQGGPPPKAKYYLVTDSA